MLKRQISRLVQWGGWVIVALMALGLGLSWAAERWVVHNLRQDVLLQAQLLGQTLDADILSIFRSSSGAPAHIRLQRQLATILQLDPRYQRVYLVASGARPLKVAVTAHKGNAQELPADQPLVWKQVFETGLPYLHEPTAAARSCLSVWVPVVDEKTGQVIAVLGLDTTPTHWRASVYQARAIPLGFVLLLLAQWLGVRVLLTRRGAQDTAAI